MVCALCSDCDINTDGGGVCRWRLSAVVAIVTASVTTPASAPSQSRVVCRVCCSVCTIARSTCFKSGSGDCACAPTCGRWWRRSRAPCPTTCHSDSLVWLLLLLYAVTACVAPLPLSLLCIASDVCIGACRVCHWRAALPDVHRGIAAVPGCVPVCCVCVGDRASAAVGEWDWLLLFRRFLRKKNAYVLSSKKIHRGLVDNYTRSSRTNATPSINLATDGTHCPVLHSHPRTNTPGLRLAPYGHITSHHVRQWRFRHCADCSVEEPDGIQTACATVSCSAP
jgi:hypothetical protein